MVNHLYTYFLNKKHSIEVDFTCFGGSLMRMPALPKDVAPQKNVLSQIFIKFFGRNLSKSHKKRYYPVPFRK